MKQKRSNFFYLRKISRHRSNSPNQKPISLKFFPSLRNLFKSSSTASVTTSEPDEGSREPEKIKQVAFHRAVSADRLLRKAPVYSGGTPRDEIAETSVSAKYDTDRTSFLRANEQDIVDGKIFTPPNTPRIRKLSKKLHDEEFCTLHHTEPGTSAQHIAVVEGEPLARKSVDYGKEETRRGLKELASIDLAYNRKLSEAAGCPKLLQDYSVDDSPVGDVEVRDEFSLIDDCVVHDETKDGTELSFDSSDSDLCESENALMSSNRLGSGSLQKDAFEALILPDSCDAINKDDNVECLLIKRDLLRGSEKSGYKGKLFPSAAYGSNKLTFKTSSPVVDKHFTGAGSSRSSSADSRKAKIGKKEKLKDDTVGDFDPLSVMLPKICYHCSILMEYRDNPFTDASVSSKPLLKMLASDMLQKGYENYPVIYLSSYSSDEDFDLSGNRAAVYEDRDDAFFFQKLVLIIFVIFIFYLFMYAYFLSCCKRRILFSKV